MIKRLTGFVVALGVLGLGLGVILPASWSVTRSVSISSTPEHIHALVDNLNQWPSWTGWDSAAGGNYTFNTNQAGSGVGSSLAWTDKRGLSVKLTITGSAHDDGVNFELAVNGPKVNGEGSIAYAFDRETQTTTVTWTEKGKLEGRPVAGFLAVMQSLTLGPRLDSALRQLKDRVERAARGG
jgi:hypothetical protein